jgi:hypothetical protein
MVLVAAALTLASPRSASIGVEAAHAQVGGELSALERQVAQCPDDSQSREQLGRAYAERGFVEEAVAQYLELLARDPSDAASRGRVEELVALRMPMWLSERAEGLAPFRRSVLDLALGDRDSAAGIVRGRFLVTQQGFSASEGYDHDRTHGWSFPRIDYGYAWVPASGRWVMKARAHWSRPEDAGLAQGALKLLLALYAVGREYLDRDPTRPLRLRSEQDWGQPVDLWLSERKEPGARSVGRDIYLYATKTNRTATEWFRELAHEYGHVAFPGIDGFTDTDDPWADGELAELLFPRWLSAGSPDWLPWSAVDAEREAEPRRREMIARARATGANPSLLVGTGNAAREHFVALALWVEEAAGPRLLGQALAQCPRGRPSQFVAAAEMLARPRGLDLWPVSGGQR